MKNLHLLPIDKPSHLYKNIHGEFGFNKEWTKIPIDRINQNSYITSDEEIKEGDWFIDDKYKQPMKYFGEGSLLISSKKIILTTDKDLIKDDVQAIDDEFLEWFVKNPSCEEVKVVPDYNELIGDCYKIIIPKEEPKQDSVNNILNNLSTEELAFLEKGKNHWKLESLKTTNIKQQKLIETLINLVIENTWTQAKLYYVMNKKEEPKQEVTLEEAARRYAKIHPTKDIDEEERYYNSNCKDYDSFKEGAEWQQERMYSEDDMHKLMDEYQDYLFKTNDPVQTFKEWFEQFKKK